MLAEACLQTLANGLLLFCFHVHQPQNRNVWNLEMSGVYHRTTIPETLFGIFCGGTRTSTNIQGCYQHLTEKKCGKWPILIKWTWLSFPYNGLDRLDPWYRLVCSISSNNEPLGDRDDQPTTSEGDEVNGAEHVRFSEKPRKHKGDNVI